MNSLVKLTPIACPLFSIFTRTICVMTITRGEGPGSQKNLPTERANLGGFREDLPEELMLKPRSQGSRELAGSRPGQRRVQRFCGEREQNAFEGRGDPVKN